MYGTQKKPKVKTETKYTSTNKFNKKKLQFAPKPDEFVVTFDSKPTPEAAVKPCRETSLAISQGINYARGFAVFQVAPDQDARAASESLQAQPEIANALPAMIDDEGKTRYFLPDEFTAQFRQGVSKKDAEKIIKEKGSRIVVEQRTPGYYTLAVPQGKGLFEILREFSNWRTVFCRAERAVFNDALIYAGHPEFSKLWGLHKQADSVTASQVMAEPT